MFRIKYYAFTIILIMTLLVTSIAYASSNIINSTNDAISLVHTYYISPTGDDSNDGLSQSAPIKTLGQATIILAAGDTLLFRGGTYTGTDNFILSGKNGTADTPITLRPYPGETPIINTTVEDLYFFGIETDYVNIEGLTFQNTRGSVGVVLVDGINTKHVNVRNCAFLNTTTAIQAYGTSYVNAENCYFDGSGSPDNEGAGSCFIGVGAEHCLVQNNYVKDGGHYSIEFMEQRWSKNEHSKYNIVRNNTIHAGWGGGIALGFSSEECLIENNRIFFTGAACPYQKTGISVTSINSVVRNNIIAYTSQGPYLDDGICLIGIDNTKSVGFFHCLNNRVYNNVVYQSGNRAFRLSQVGNNDITGNKLLNNIFYQNNYVGVPGINNPGPEFFFNTANSGFSYPWNDLAHGNYYYNNIMLSSDGINDNPGKTDFIKWDNKPKLQYSLQDIQSTLPNNWHNNYEFAPGFVNPNTYDTNADFHLQSGSPAIDAGAHLSKTTSAGANTATVPLDDAIFFCDGKGLIDGDFIQVGSSQPARVTNVDYTNNVLTIDTPVTFNSGDYVDLLYSGSAPDLGAFEYNPQVVPTPIITSDTNIPTPIPFIAPTGIVTIDDWFMNRSDHIEYCTGTGVNQIQYFGSWAVYGPSPKAFPPDNPDTLAYNKTLHKSLNNNNYLVLTFEGTQVRLYGMTNYFYGIGALSIDGGEETMVDFFSDDKRGDVALYQSTILPPGVHQLKLRATGTGNPNSLTSTSIIVDKFDIYNGVEADQMPTPIPCTPRPKSTATPVKTIKPTATPVQTVTPVSTIAPTPILVTFPDIGEFDWAKNSIEYLATAKIINGVSGEDGILYFMPANSVTRAEFCKLIVRAYIFEQSGAPKDFIDVVDHWAKADIAIASSLEIVKGYEDNTFRPEAEISRQELAVMTARAMNKLHIGITVAENEVVTKLSVFIDQEDIASWARSDVAFAVENGIIKGSPYGEGYKFLPLDSATRAETAVMIKRAYDKKNL